MSLRLQPVSPVPEETERVARAAFPKGNIYVMLRDELGAVLQESVLSYTHPALATLPRDEA